MMIAHPPCTYLSYAGEGYFNIDRYGDKALKRWDNRIEAMRFFMALMNADVPLICCENPKGFPMGYYRSPDQTIQPYYFGDSAMKTTCLWLKGLPQLIHSTGNLFEQATAVGKPEPTYVDKRRVNGAPKKRYFTDSIAGGSEEARKARSKTFQGIADAMADQWGNLDLKSVAA